MITCVTDFASVNSLHIIMYQTKAVFFVRRCQWKEEGTPYTFHSCFNVAMEYDVFRLFNKLVCICNSTEQIMQPGTSSPSHRKIDRPKLQGGKNTNFKASRRLPGLSILYGHNKGKCNVDINIAPLSLQCINSGLLHYFAQFNIQNFAIMINKQDNP